MLQKREKSKIKRGKISNKDNTKINISFWSWRKREQKRIREKRRERKKKKKKCKTREIPISGKRAKS